jgi:hypothetical protein
MNFSFQRCSIQVSLAKKQVNWAGLVEDDDDGGLNCRMDWESKHVENKATSTSALRASGDGNICFSIESDPLSTPD